MDTRPEVLSLRDVARYLQVTEKTVYRMVRAGRLPGRRVGGLWRFRRADLDSWFEAEMPRLPERAVAAVSHAVFPGEIHLWECIPEKSVRVGLRARDKEAAIRETVSLLGLTPRLQSFVLHLVLARETTCTTGLGDGIAVPHPMVGRMPNLAGHRPVLAVGILRRPIPWESIDGRPVSLVFLPLAPNETLHLLMLARLNRLLRRDGFLAAIRRARSPRRVVEAFRDWALRLDEPVPEAGGAGRRRA